MQERSIRPQSTLAGGMDDISSPDLGVDLGSDPFSSLERTGKKTYQSISRECIFSGKWKWINDTWKPYIYIVLDIPAPVNLLVEENHRLRSDNEKLMSKLTQSKGVLKDTLERLATNSSNEAHQSNTGNTTSSTKESTRPMLPTASRTRLFSQAINACQLDKQIASITQKERRTNLKEEFLEFSRTHSSPKKPSGKRGNHRNASPTKQSNNKNSDKQ